MIPMTDMDVQQVRDHIVRKKIAKITGKPSGNSPTQAKAQGPPAQPYHHAEEAKKKREAIANLAGVGYIGFMRLGANAAKR